MGYPHGRQGCWPATPFARTAKSKSPFIQHSLLTAANCQYHDNDTNSFRHCYPALFDTAPVYFCCNSIAELWRISAADLKPQLPDLEKQLLQDFNQFVAKHPPARWLHWNMRDTGFGFAVFAQRARVHGLEPFDIPARVAI